VEHSAPALVTAASALGVQLIPAQAEQLLAQLELLERWNRTHNLVGPGSPAEWLERHTLDSLAAARFLPPGKGFDVGSGAGFPGVPLAIARPDCQLALVEPRDKRAAFLSNTVAALSLRNATVVREHLEASDEPGDAQFAVSRATLPLPVWLKLAATLLAPRGLAIAFLGLESWRPDRIQAAAAEAGLVDPQLEPYAIGSQPTRALALFRHPG
jgi:16S rRNA (guanine527-N7)-methyltransferase